MWSNCSSNGLRRRHAPVSIGVIGAVVLTLCLIGDSPGDFDLAMDNNNTSI